MKKLQLFLVMAIVLSLSSCQLVGDIFKAGVWVGVLMVAAVIGVIIFLLTRIGGR